MSTVIIWPELSIYFISSCTNDRDAHNSFCKSKSSLTSLKEETHRKLPPLTAIMANCRRIYESITLRIHPHITGELLNTVSDVTYSMSDKVSSRWFTFLGHIAVLMDFNKYISKLIQQCWLCRVILHWFSLQFSLLLVQTVMFNSVQKSHKSTAFTVNISHTTYLQQIVSVTFTDSIGNSILCVTAKVSRSLVRTFSMQSLLIQSERWFSVLKFADKYLCICTEHLLFQTRCVWSEDCGSEGRATFSRCKAARSRVVS